MTALSYLMSGQLELDAISGIQRVITSFSRWRKRRMMSFPRRLPGGPGMTYAESSFSNAIAPIPIRWARPTRHANTSMQALLLTQDEARYYCDFGRVTIVVITSRE